MGSRVCPWCAAPWRGSDVVCTSCGRRWAGSAGSDGPRGGSQVAPPVPPQVSHPFSDARELVVRLAPEGSDPPGLQILDDGRHVRGTLRGDGIGFHLLLRNFVLEDAAHRVVYRFHRPPARLPLAMGGVCYLLQPDGREAGLLRRRWGWRSSTCTFERAGEAPLVAVRSPRAWEEYEIHQAGESLGSVWVDQTIFPAALHLTFTEQTPDRSPRSRLVALVAFTSLLSRVRRRSARVPR